MISSCNFRWTISTMLATLIIHTGWFASESAVGAQRVYNLITNQSSIAVSGSVSNTTLGTAPIQQQGAGSLTTAYSGTINTDRAAGSIAFLAGGVIDANVSGDWQPLADGSAGSAAADYGAKVSYLFGAVTVNFAARNFLTDLNSPVLTLSGSSFGLATTNVLFTDGSVAYRSSTGSPLGSQTVLGSGGPLSGNGTLGTVYQSGDTLETLTIPIDSSFTIPVDATTTVDLTLTGQLYATAIVLSGDYNQNGVVDAADYVVWRNNAGNVTDFNTWSSNFGKSYSLAGGSGAVLTAGAAVPEPSSAMLLVAALIVGRVRCRPQVTR
jgi:prepilin-type processing-associated H-X9-DG protein